MGNLPFANRSTTTHGNDTYYTAGADADSRQLEAWVSETLPPTGT